MKRVLYITYNDAPTGIYSGQVIDVCRFLKNEMGYDVRLVAFLSIRGFAVNKRKITSAFPGAIVRRMVPKARNWKWNRFLLKRVFKKLDPQVVVCRGPFAAALAIMMRDGKKICFDGRGAYKAELNEYDVVPDEKVKSEIAVIERSAVLDSDFRLAVSGALVQYWKREFDYDGKNHVVIPCTLNRSAFNERYSEETLLQVRKRYGFTHRDIIVAYSGSLAGWQSLDGMDNFSFLLRSNPQLKLLLLCNENDSICKLRAQFPGRVVVNWLPSSEVAASLSTCDYGWLVREKSVTNEVASPVKFAEYLHAGLKVIISDELGDFTSFVREHDAGILWNRKEVVIPPVNEAEKKRMKKLAESFFSKETYREEYGRMIS